MKYFQVIAFAPNGNPTTFENKKHTTREAAEQRMTTLEKVYDVKLFISERSV
jgi:hypothetical protein